MNLVNCNVDYFMAGRWLRLAYDVELRAACRVAASFHRKGCKVRVFDGDGAEVPSKFYTGTLPPEDEEILSTFTRRIGP